MRFAAIILAFKEPEQVNILTKQLLAEFGDDIDVFVHVSGGSEWMIERLFLTKHVTIFPEHIGEKNIDPTGKGRGQWANDTLLRRMLYTFSYVEANSDAKYYMVFSGQDMIVKKGLKEFLLEHPRSIYMDGCVDDKRQRARLVYKWGPIFKTKYDSKIHPIRLLRRALLSLYSTGIKVNMQKNYHLLDGLVICKNLYWMNLPSDCVRYCLDFAENNSEIMDIFFQSICPEESFFSTVLYNNERFKPMFNWCDEINYRSLTFYGKFTTSFPLVEAGDVSRIDNSGCFIAKKFSLSCNKELVDYYFNKVSLGE